MEVFPVLPSTLEIRKSGVSKGKGVAQVQRLAHGIVGTRQAARRGHSFFEGGAGPCVVSRLTGGGSGVKSPRFPAGLRIVGRDVAILPLSGAGPPRDDLSIDDDRAGRVPAGVGLGLAAQLSRAGVQTDYETIGRRIEDHILIDGDVLGSRGIRYTAGYRMVV